ncbi:hypothetical protein J1614_005471 [Plenodomus biglobosus]|nr:hypothetical protein J1614_005471 [Plenodomus biglobosus]
MSWSKFAESLMLGNRYVINERIASRDPAGHQDDPVIVGLRMSDVVRAKRREVSVGAFRGVDGCPVCSTTVDR